LKKPVLVIIAGPNGAGKSTLHAGLAEYNRLPFVNADMIARARFEDIGEAESRAAQQEAQAQIMLRLQDQESFCFETVFSHISKIDLIRTAQTFGYEVELCIVSNDTEETNVARVKHRAAKGGHDVPSDKIRTRRVRTHVNLREAILIADRFRIFDTSQGHVVEVARSGGLPGYMALAEVPVWAQEILAKLTSRSGSGDTPERE
jgi:predicted ABC-type ATPase